MANATVTRIGQANGAGDTDALFLKVFSGEVISQFEKHTVTLDKHSIRTIQAGKSAQFPVLGRTPAAEYHTPGAEIVGQSVPNAERVITIDQLLIKHAFIADIDDAMSHFEVRSKYSMDMGQGLAQTFDNHVMREIVLAAAASPTITAETGQDGYNPAGDDNLASATDSTKLDAWIDAMYNMAINFDNKFVTGTRYAAMKPEDYRFLAKAVLSNGFSVVNRDYNGVGSFAQGEAPVIAGIDLISSPMLPTADYSGETYHAVDCSLVKCIGWTEDAVGTVKLMDLSMQSEWDIRRQGTLMVARYAMGHGILRPEASAVLTTAT